MALTVRRETETKNNRLIYENFDRYLSLNDQPTPIKTVQALQSCSCLMPANEEDYDSHKIPMIPVQHYMYY